MCKPDAEKVSAPRWAVSNAKVDLHSQYFAGSHKLFFFFAIMTNANHDYKGHD